MENLFCFGYVLYYKLTIFHQVAVPHWITLTITILTRGFIQRVERVKNYSSVIS